MMHKISRLTANDNHRLMELFLECFEDDHMYAELFPDKTTRRQDMKKKFCGTLDFCVRYGGSYGIERDGHLEAFLLFFDYQSTKNRLPQDFAEIFGGTCIDGRFTLPNQKKLHDRIAILGENITYLLSVGVSPALQRTGYGSALIDFLISNHTTDFIVSDVSNSASLPIYERRGFFMDKLEEDYYFVKRAPENPLSGEYFEGTVKLAMPDAGIVERLNIKVMSSAELTLHGYETTAQSEYRFFIKNPVADCAAVVVEISYAALLEYQRFINVSHFDECCLHRDETGSFLLYARTKKHCRSELLFNDELEQMTQTRPVEWGIIPDIQALFPVEYRSIEEATSGDKEYERNVEAFLRYMDFRTHYEAGVPKTFDEENKSDEFKHRIKRYYLGKLQIKITREITADSYGELGRMIGQPAYVDMVLAVDNNSKCGVLTLISLSSPFLVSHFLDNIIRNQFLVVEDSGEVKNLYDYIYERFALQKRGAPKMLVTIPREKECMNPHAMASLLMAETIYESDEDMGGLCDQGLMDAVTSENGMGQYDRAFVCANTNVCLQFNPQLKSTLKARMNEETVACFYIELLLFEESAIETVSHKLTEFLSSHDGISTRKFLKHTYRIYDEYSKTVEFWDIQVNYPSSKKSLSMLREAFKVSELLSRMERNQNQLSAVFETQRDIMDRADSAALNYIMLFLTIMQGVSIIVPALFDIEVARLTDRMLGIGIITLAMLIYWAFKALFGAGFKRPDTDARGKNPR